MLLSSGLSSLFVISLWVLQRANDGCSHFIDEEMEVREPAHRRVSGIQTQEVRLEAESPNPVLSITAFRSPSWVGVSLWLR